MKENAVFKQVMFISVGQEPNMYACDFDKRSYTLCEFATNFPGGWILDTHSTAPDLDYGPFNDHTNPSQGMPYVD